MARLHGIWGYPFIDLEPFVASTALGEIHEEICLGLTKVDVSYTGGSLKWMEVVAPAVAVDPYVDYMLAISKFDHAQFEAFVSLADDPSIFDVSRKEHYSFGDETDHPLNRRQMLYMKYRYGVYFPWKVVYHFVENERWEDKNQGAGKSIPEEAERLFPKTVALIRSLPFVEIGRCLIFGMEANDHAPLHQDTAPGSRDEVENCITICPAGNKRLYLTDDDQQDRIDVRSRMYWFNDMDWHGVEPDPFFRYSIRVDGVFKPEFVDMLRRKLCT
jgi:Rieske 2Fe-2S family protein